MNEPAKRRGSGLKINNQHSSIPIPPKQTQKEIFDMQATEASKKIEGYKARTWELSGRFKEILQDQTLAANKTLISKDVEIEILNKIIVLALEMDSDETQPEGFGSTALCMLLMKMLLLQRDTINNIAFKLDQLDKQSNK